MSEPKVEIRAEQPYAAIPIKAPLREWDRVNALVGEVFDWLAARGVAPAGPLFYRYHVIGGMDDPFDLEVGVPVASPVRGDGRVIAGAVPPGPYATLVHAGHPDRVLESITALQTWAAARGLEWNNRHENGTEIWGGRFEFYLTNPADEPDPDRWRTELAHQLRNAPAG